MSPVSKRYFRENTHHVSRYGRRRSNSTHWPISHLILSSSFSLHLFFIFFFVCLLILSILFCFCLSSSLFLVFISVFDGNLPELNTSRCANFTAVCAKLKAQFSATQVQRRLNVFTDQRAEEKQLPCPTFLLSSQCRKWASVDQEESRGHAIPRGVNCKNHGTPSPGFALKENCSLSSDSEIQRV